MLNPRTSRVLLAPVLVAAALALGACGSDDKVDAVTRQATELQQQGKDVQKAAEQAAEDVKAGRKTPEQVNEEIAKKTKALQDKAKDTASKAIDAAKAQGDVPDEAQKALDDAKKQIETAP